MKEKLNKISLTLKKWRIIFIIIDSIDEEYIKRIFLFFKCYGTWIIQSLNFIYISR